MRKLNLFLVLVFLVIAGTLMAQQVNTLYFMRNVPERNAYNPAFQPIQNIYIDLPIFPNIVASMGNNSVAFGDVFFVKNENGESSLINFLSLDADAAKFISKLKKDTYFHFDAGVSLLNFGFRYKKVNYFTLGINQRILADMSLSKDLFSLVLDGTNDVSTAKASYNLDNLGVSATAFTEIGAGYSRKMNDKLTVGCKLKYLIGQADMSTSINGFRLEANASEFLVKGNGKLKISMPAIDIPVKDNTIDPDDITTGSLSDYSWDDIMLTSNWGFGMDLGVTYKPIKQLQLSAAVVDLGFINWNQNTTSASLAENAKTEINYTGNEDWQDKLDSLRNIFEDAFTQDANHDSYTTYLHTRINAGAEYGFWKDRLSVGVLSSTFFAYNVSEEVTASLNFTPCKFFSATASYTLTDGEYSTIGAGMQVHAYPFNFYVAADHIPFSYSKDGIPTDLKSTSVQIGCTMAFGNVLMKKKKNTDSIANALPEKVDTVKKDTAMSPVVSKVDTTPHMTIAVPLQSGLEGIHFKLGKSEIPSVSHSILDQLVNLMKKHPEYKVTLIGYTDAQEAVGSEKKLSSQRANNVKDYLLKKGIAESRVSVVANGSEQPIVDGATAGDMSRNRRVEFDIR